jgi:hypothetical protein
LLPLAGVGRGEELRGGDVESHAIDPLHERSM